MARVVGNVPNFINGISQQPAQLRLSSQAESQTNCYSTVAKGLVARPSTEHIARVSSANSNDSFVHFINRDTTEQYVVVYDDAHSATSPNVLTVSEQSLANWTNVTGATDAEVAHTDALPSYDGHTAYTQVTFDGTPGAAMTLANFHTMGATEAWTLSVWMRLRTDTTLTDVDNKLTLSGADFAATVDQAFNALAYNVWTKVEVTGTSVASPTGSAITAGVYCDEAVVIDIAAPQFEQASAATLTVWGSAKPKLKIFSLTGVEQQVWCPDGEAYLAAATSPNTNIKALTVADYTFLTNGVVQVAMNTAVASAAAKYEALIAFESIQPGTTLSIDVNGTTEWTVSVSDTDPTHLGTAYQCDLAYTAMTTGGGTDFTAGDWSIQVLGGGAGIGNTIYLTNSTTDFTIAARDDDNAEGIRVVKSAVQTFGELPRWGKEDMIVQVKGNADNDWSSFWVKFDGADGSDGITSWSETVGPAINTTFDLATMPQIVTRNGSSTFTCREGEWSAQVVGDDTTNAQPSFVGEYLNEIFFTDGRLGLLAGENVILSQVQGAGDGIFNFWRTSVTSLLDGDPIDVSSTHTKVSILRHAVPYQEQLLLFSDQTQFRLTKGDILSPKTVGIEPITEFESSRVAKPAAVGNFVFFVVEKSDYATVREYFIASDTRSNDAREITGHVPEYVPSDVVALRGSSNEDLLLMQVASEDDSFYCYKYFWSGEQKVQSAWFKWTFPDVTKILGYQFYESRLYMLMKRADGVFIERMELDSGAQDDSATGYNLSTDRKLLDTDSEVSAAYNSGTDQTTYTFATMTWKSVPNVIGIAGNSDTHPPGYETTIVGSPTSYNANTIILEGDTTSDTFMFGLAVDKTYQLSELSVKATGDGNAKVPIAEGRLQLQRIKFVFADSGYFKWSVVQQGRAETKEYIYTGRAAGSTENTVNELPIESGVFSVPVHSRNYRVSITMTSSSPMPFRLLSADWTGMFHARGKRI